MSSKTLPEPAKKTASAPKRSYLALKIAIGIGVVCLLLGLVGIWVLLRQPSAVQFGSQQLQLERVSSPEDLARGLSGRESMAETRGMLFVFPGSGRHCMWMKDMQFSLDMIWLDESKRVVSIAENVAPETYPESLCPDQPARYVIEVNAGTAQQAGISEGSQLQF